MSASSDTLTTQFAQVVAESLRQVGLTPGTLPSPRSPFEPSPSDSIELRWKKKLMKSLSLREYFWPPQWARNRLEKLIQNAGRGLTRPSTVSLAGDVTVQVGAGDESVEVGNSQMDFIDGFEYACQLMVELDFPPAEITARKDFVRWLFWHPSLSEKARMVCAEKFLVRYHGHPNWSIAAKEETFIWMEGINLSSPAGGLRAGSSSRQSSSPRRIARKRKAQSQSAGDKKQAQSKQKDSSGKEKSAARAPPEGRIAGTCDSRVAKHIACRFEKNGGDGSECAFSHICPRCPNVNHSAASCGKM